MYSTHTGHVAVCRCLAWRRLLVCHFTAYELWTCLELGTRIETIRDGSMYAAGAVTVGASGGSERRPVFYEAHGMAL